MILSTADARSHFRRQHSYLTPVLDEAISRNGRSAFTACIPWQGMMQTRTGGAPYPIYYAGQNVSARRVVFEMAHQRTLQPAEVVGYACGDPRCVNPNHLYVATAETIARERMLSEKYSVKGEAHPQAKLTEADVHEIRTLARGNITYQSLGEIFGCSKRNIGYIVNYKRWGHV